MPQYFQGTSSEDLARITALENNLKLCLYYGIITSGTTGTIDPPTGGTISLDGFAGKADAIICGDTNTYPDFTSVYTSGSVLVATTLDSGGNYSLTGTPASYPVCILYYYTVKTIDFDVTKSIGSAVDLPASSQIFATSPLFYDTITHTLTIQVSDATHNGYLSSTDWSTFNSKQAALSFGNLTESTSSVLTITGGTGSVIGSGTTIQIKQSSASVSGYLSSTDWSTFNGKESVLTFSSGVTRLVNNITNDLITGLTGGQTIIGGTAVTDAINYKGTTGNGTLTAIAHSFLVGNNGATVAGSIYNNGNINIGNGIATNQRLFQVGQDTAFISFGSLVGSTSNWAIYGNQTSPSVSNFALRGSATATYLGATSSITLSINGSNNAVINTTGSSFLKAIIGSVNTAEIGSAILTVKGSGTGTALSFQTFQSDGTTISSSVSDAGNFYIKNNLGIGVLQASTTARLQIAAGTASSGTAPIKLTSGVLLSTTEAGAIEFLTDKFYQTITTGAGTAVARKTIQIEEDYTKIFLF